jgi:hypothetical protein
MPNWQTAEVFPLETGRMLTGEWLRAAYPPLDLLELIGAKALQEDFAGAS